MTPFGPVIPGETPIDDISGLRLRAISSKAELNAAEAENIRAATLKYLAARPNRRLARFDVDWLLKLHREMFGTVWTWAGEIRQVELNIGSPVTHVRIDLVNLVDDLRAWEASTMPLDEQAARLHHRAVWIHPFRNGNGRWSRLLANIWLRLHGAPLVQWPEATIGDASVIRDEYLAAIRAADGHDLAPLYQLHRRYTMHE